MLYYFNRGVKLICNPKIFNKIGRFNRGMKTSVLILSKKHQ